VIFILTFIFAANQPLPAQPFSTHIGDDHDDGVATMTTDRRSYFPRGYRRNQRFPGGNLGSRRLHRQRPHRPCPGDRDLRQNQGPSTPAVGAQDDSGRFPKLLYYVQVVIGGIPAPLLYISDEQINTVTPVSLDPSKATTIQIVRSAVAAPPFRAVIIAAANDNATCSATTGDIIFKVIPAEVVYCGDAPGTIFGVTQINVRIPDDVASFFVGPGVTYISI
jgi:hypothetical protein